MADTVARARDAFDRQAWGEALALLTSADAGGLLGPEDLERLATAAYLTGRDEESAAAMERAHHAFGARGEPQRAAGCAFWLGMALFGRGETASASGWLARARRLLAEAEDCVEHGYLRFPMGLSDLFAGDAEAALATFRDVAAIADRFHDADLTALGRLGIGRALIRLGRPSEGMPLLDEVMVAVKAGEVSPIPAGFVYCAVIEACHAAFDVARAQEWTAALSSWCAAQPDLVPFRGQCLVHRSQLLQLRGAWSDAMDEVLRACERLSDPPGQPAIGEARYQCAELHRLRGELDQAEEAYREASAWGRNPQPGLALLRLAQGRPDAALAAVRRALEEAGTAQARARLLAPYVEIMLAAGDVAAAREGADELAQIAAGMEAPLLDAVCAHVTGAVRIVEGDATGALVSLRQASAAWRALDAPYESARVRVLIALACRELGDADGAELELEAARTVFDRLGARPELERLTALTQTGPTADGLSARELEVLRLVAAGRTNREIATDLVISEHTVARHVQNIFAKLGVTSRTAAAAFAFERHLV